LQNIEDDPIDRGDDPVQGKWSVVVTVLAPNCAAVVTAFMRSLKGIVDGGYDKDEP